MKKLYQRVLLSLRNYHPICIVLYVLCLAMSRGSAHAQELRSDINLSDPFVMADAKTNQYYMTGTGGGLWRSNNLETWTYLGFPLQFDSEAWMGAKPAVWASEIHYVDGRYYNFSTLTNSDITIDSDGHSRRAVHIMSSSLPEGKYTLIAGGDETYVPAEKTTLDASYFEDTDGRRYLIYCHEWIQNGNGTIEYIELKPDMTGSLGEGIVMTRAHDATWNTSPVTDGPYLFRTKTGRLGMIWTSWHGGRYVQGVAYSTTGKLSGPWKHEPLPVTPDNYGHGMLFHTFDGQLLMSIHSHRTINESKQQWERHPVLFVMDDSGDHLRTVMEYKAEINAANPAQVMVDNPEFEYGKQGWTCTTGAQNQLIATNQSGAITGNFFESWDSNSFIGEIYQEKSVPNGTYQFTAAAFRSQLASGGSQDAKTVWLFANDSVCLVDNTTPQNYTITVHVTDGRMRFGLRSTRKNFRWMGIDNAKILYFGEGLLTADDIADAQRNTAVYLRNKRDGKYLNAGQSWGTQAVLDKHPLDFHLVSLANGKYAIDSHINNGGGNHYVSANGYLDGALTAFSMNWTEENTVTLTTDGNHYWGSSGTNVVNTKLSASAKGVEWLVLHRDDLLAELEEATPELPADATFLIQCPGFGRNDTRSSAWIVSKNSTNFNLSSGNNVNNCAESYHSPFTISQTLADAPVGTYALTAQGFYRQDESKTEQPPVFFLGDETTTFPVCTGSESSTSDASVSFTANRYTIKPILFYYDGNAPLTLGIRSTAKAQWAVWDNFQLQYMGSGNSTGIEEIVNSQVSNEDGTVYDIEGRRVLHSSFHHKSIYVNRGRKYLSNH